MRTRLGLIGVVSLLSVGLFAACGSQPSATSTPALPTLAIPTQISVLSSQRLILKVRGVGVQIYACRPNAGQVGESHSYGWTLKAPEASLLNAYGVAIGKHYEGPTWEMNDGSKVVGMAQTSVAAPDSNGIPWLLLTAVRNEGVGALTPVRAIQRIQTVGGKAPATGCDLATENSEVRVPYEAMYYFYINNA